jgi:UrcA family protein
VRTQEGKIAMFRTVTSVALALSSILGSAAVARVDEVPTQIVHFADLDLTSPEGVKVLQRRVSQAIVAVCGSLDIRDLDQTRMTMACRRDAGKSAATQMASAIDNSGRLATRAEPIRLAGR